MNWMEDVQFDTANEQFQTIAETFLASEKLAGEWDAAALAVILTDNGYDASGFKYRADGKIIPIAPRERELYQQITQYRDFLARETGDPPFKTCLIQLNRTTQSFEMTLEYKDAMRWKIVPSNLKELRELMRP